MAQFWSRKADQRTLVVTSGSTVKRDVYKAATAGLTGMTAFGALAVTGAVAGSAAHQKALDDASNAAQPAAPTTPQVVTERRPHRTVVRTRVVHAASGGTVARPGSGGAVSSHASSGGSSSHASTSHSGGSTTTTHTAPKPAAPAPPPAPSSGS